MYLYLCGSVGKDFVYHACGHEFESRLKGKFSNFPHHVLFLFSDYRGMATRRSWRCWHRTRTTLWPVFSSKCGPSAMSASPRSSIVLQGTTKSTRKKSQEGGMAKWFWAHFNQEVRFGSVKCQSARSYFRCLIKDEIIIIIIIFIYTFRIAAPWEWMPIIRQHFNIALKSR